jgi:hypothetical protein
MSGSLSAQRNQWHQDVAVLAFPTPADHEPIEGLDLKALHKTDPYTIMKQTPRFVPPQASYPAAPEDAVIQPQKILDLTDRLQPDGSLNWQVPAGDWTVMRFAACSTGQTTRPAPRPGHGFEVDKFDAGAYTHHFDQFHRKLLDKVGPRSKGKGWTAIHLDSWEMGSQNWTADFRQAFVAQCGYDPLPFYPAYAGKIVESREVTERFLWDLRRVAQELVLNEYIGTIKKLAHENGFDYTSQGYDMNPAGDLDLLSLADIPSCEFWFTRNNSIYGCLQAVSAAHIMGKPVVRAEAFTAHGGFQVSPQDMKNQTNWAFAMGINDLIFHTYQHQPLGKDGPKPGMAMGRWGIHWHRNQTFWPMVGAYHNYIARAGQLLRQGVSVTDILYLTPEGAPHIFLPPEDAVTEPILGKNSVPYHGDKKGYSFDAISPRMLMERAQVIDGKIAFENGTTYEVMVLPLVETMTPELLKKIETLVKAGATVIGAPPQASPSLVNYPECDAMVAQQALRIWGGTEPPKKLAERALGKGRVLWGGASTAAASADRLYPSYASTQAILAQDGLPEIFSSGGNLRFHQRRTAEQDIFFVANRDASPQTCVASFRTAGSHPQLWDAQTGARRALSEFQAKENGTVDVLLSFAPHEGYFIVFDRSEPKGAAPAGTNFPEHLVVQELAGPWQVRFDPEWGGPKDAVSFDALQDWSKHAERGIQYYSGIAVYEQRFDAVENDETVYLSLGRVEDIAKVRLNGRDLGTVWSAPFRVAIPQGLLKPSGNRLQVAVANVWQNRLVGDQQKPDRRARTLQWDNGMLAGKPQAAGRYTFSTHYNGIRGDSPLSPSGLLGPVKITRESE